MAESIQNLYSALTAHGLKKKDVQAILPSWWEDGIAETPAGLQQAKLIVAKALNLKVRPLVEDPPRVEFDLPEMRRFKLMKGTTEDDVQLAVALARSASKLVLSAFDREFQRPDSAEEVRRQILATGRPWVDLEGLVEYCWKVGIPVIHLASSLMKRKMDGIAMATKGRPTIVLSSRKACGYLLFHLAHELGHVALGHLDPNGAIVDNNIQDDPDGKDEAERAADAYALELLAGKQAQLTLSRFVAAPVLARMAKEFGTQHAIDPTHVLLNSAHNGNFWPLCTATLGVLAEGRKDQELIAQHLLANVQSDLKEDSLALLGTLVGQ
ncbi:ImmA/IrrE family metallo-endopeptidase [Pseudomonas sp. 2835]|uniref:ImmA/IrrE family metallo-endopeptidase n=1 Tax=Pseudomonas sp. 2835 TaxID=3156451 RepID=UPI003D199234